MQDTVDRHARDLGELATDRTVQLFGSRVIGAVEDRLVTARPFSRWAAKKPSSRCSLSAEFMISWMNIWTTCYTYAKIFIEE